MKKQQIKKYTELEIEFANFISDYSEIILDNYDDYQYSDDEHEQNVYRDIEEMIEKAQEVLNIKA